MAWKTTKVAYATSLFLIAGIMPSAAQATNLFHFVQDGSGDVLATLTIDFPVNSESLADGLSFTSAGDALFGFGVGPYQGSFDDVTGELENTGIFNDELRTDPRTRHTAVFDNTPPHSITLDPNMICDCQFAMDFPEADSPRRARMVYAGFSNPGFGTEGAWVVLVPEPSTLIMALGLLPLASCRWKPQSQIISI